jgi:HSP20 family protein
MEVHHGLQVAGSVAGERRFGAFSRSVRLPFEVKDEKVDAKYVKGVLTIRVPKPVEAQKAVRQIEVKAA